MPNQHLVRAYVNKMILYQGRDEGLSPNGRKYAFVQVWAAIPRYRWDDGDARDPITRLADLIRDRDKRGVDRGLEWVDLNVQSAVDDALTRDFDRIPGKKKAAIVDSEIVDSVERLVGDPAEALEQLDLQEALMEAISTLDPVDQWVLEAAYRANRRGLNIAEVQEVLGCVKSTAHKRILKITKALSRMLDKHE